MIFMMNVAVHRSINEDVAVLRSSSHENYEIHDIVNSMIFMKFMKIMKFIIPRIHDFRVFDVFTNL